jgi:hypothetical protein
MRATTILAIVTIVAALGAVTSFIPVQHVSAAGQPENFPDVQKVSRYRI